MVRKPAEDWTIIDDMADALSEHAADVATVEYSYHPDQSLVDDRRVVWSNGITTRGRVETALMVARQWQRLAGKHHTQTDTG